VSVVHVDGIDGEVVIHRDEWGIPHAQGASAHDAFFAQGFVQAADRLFQLEYDRRRAYGRWAEVVGARALDFDLFARRCGLRAAAEREYQALAPEARGVLDAYAEGVNAWLALDAPMPSDLRAAGVTPERWQPWDCCAVFLVRHVVFASWQKKLWRARVVEILGVDAVARIEAAAVRQELPLIVPPGKPFTPSGPDPTELAALHDAMAILDDRGGSNSWAFHGSRTASGLPLVAGDPHRMVEVPGVYYQVHLACDAFDAIGLAFVGVPGLPHFGHNEHVAWCVTNAYGDYQDLFVDRFETEPTPTRREAVEVADGEPTTIECYESAHGPVVFGDPRSGVAISLCSTALAEPSTGMSVLLPMLTARNVGELEDVMRGWVDPVNNFVSAGVDGSIGYHTVGRIPVRSHANAWGPVPGWTGTHDWHGEIPYDELPQLRDPEGGLIITANQRIVDDSYPYFISAEYARPDRAIRLHERLRDVRRATVEDMPGIHTDRQSLGADVWVERLLRLEPRDEWERTALLRLGEWDRNMDADSAAAAIYAVARDAACRIVAHNPVLSPLRVPMHGEPAATFVPLELRLWTALPGLLGRDDTMLLPSNQSWDDVLAAAFTDAIGVLRTALGDEVGGWRWGALHVAAPRHPLGRADLDPPTVEMGGEWDTVMSAAHAAGSGFNVTTSSVARYAFDLADWDRSGWVVPLGSSGDPTSPHFADQQSAWAAGELLPMRFSWDAIVSRAESTTRLASGA
jgi:penicillin amidase